MNKLDITEDGCLNLNGMKSEPIAPEHRSLYARMKKMAADKEFRIIVTTNPLAPVGRCIDDVLYNPVMEEIEHREADFILSMGKLTNDVDGFYGMSVVKGRVPAAADWEVREDGRYIVEPTDVVLSIIPQGDAEGTSKTFINYLEKDDAEHSEG